MRSAGIRWHRWVGGGLRPHLAREAGENPVFVYQHCIISVESAEKGFVASHGNQPVSPSAGEVHDQVNRVLHSAMLGGSQALRHLLLYLADHAVLYPAQPAREKEIALGVFSRPADFDARTDSVVRVHAGRLRSKLAEYYVKEGAADRVILEVPKGAYLLVPYYREPAVRELGVAPAQVDAPPAPPGKSRVFFTKLAAGAVLLVAASAVVYYVGSFRATTLPAPEGKALQAFWKGFFLPADAPLIIFGNPRFVGSDFEGMRYLRDSDDPRSAVIETFTSVGELAGVFEITRLLSSLGQSPILRRAQLLTWNDAADRNLVIVGSPTSIRALREQPFLQEFRFRDRTTEPRPGAGAIVNNHPLPGEEPVYFGPDTRPYAFDYAVVARLPGLRASRWTLVLAGITSYGTQAAAEMVCRERLAEQLLAKPGSAGGTPPKFFESLIRVKVSGGVPMQSEVLITRIRK